MTDEDIAAIRWAMAQAGLSARDVVALILGAHQTPAPRPPAARPKKPTQMDRLARPKKPTQMDRLVEFIEGELDVRVRDVVAYGITSSFPRAAALLSQAAAQGLITRTGHGVYIANDDTNGDH